MPSDINCQWFSRLLNSHRHGGCLFHRKSPQSAWNRAPINLIPADRIFGNRNLQTTTRTNGKISIHLTSIGKRNKPQRLLVPRAVTTAFVFDSEIGTSQHTSLELQFPNLLLFIKQN